MRPNTSASGIFSTKRSSPVSTRTLTRILVPNPNKAFQSPGTQNFGLNVVVALIARFLVPRLSALLCQRRDHVLALPHPAKNSTLGFDHFQAHLLKPGKIRSDAVFRNEAVVATIVGFAHSRVDANLGGDAGHHQFGDAVVLQDRVQIGGEESALARLVDHRFTGPWIQFRNDVMARLTAHQNAAHRPGVADTRGASAADFLGRRQIREIGPVPLPRVHYHQPRATPGRQQPLVWFDRASQWRSSIYK